MVAALLSGNETSYLLKLSCEPPYLLLMFNHGFISPYVTGMLKTNALRIRRVSFIRRTNVTNEGLE